MSNRFDTTVGPYLSFLDNEYVNATLTIFLIVYASVAAPELPDYIADLFDYTAFRMVIFFLIAYLAGSSRNPTVAIIAALAFVVSIMALNKIQLDKYVKGAVGTVQGAVGTVQSVITARENFDDAPEDIFGDDYESDYEPVQ